MSASDRTKQLLADKLIEMSETKPIQDIRVKDLCTASGTDRSTFYYHFKDEYDLVAWIFMQLFEKERSLSPIENSEEMIEGMLRGFWSERDFFRNALKDRSQNSLDTYLLDFYIRSEREAICRYRGAETLDEETEYVIRQYSYGCLGTTIEWILGKNGLSVESMAHYQYLCMPDILKRAWMADASGMKNHSCHAEA